MLTFVAFGDKNIGVRVICSAGYNPENAVDIFNAHLILWPCCQAQQKWQGLPIWFGGKTRIIGMH